MQGYSPKLPLIVDRQEDGPYALNKTLLDTIKQNFKMLLLTSPGERVMNSDFGVGVRAMLFEQDDETVREVLSSRILSQVKRYLNFIRVEEINISPPDSNQENMIFINIRYSVPSLNVNDELNIEV